MASYARYSSQLSSRKSFADIDSQQKNKMPEQEEIPSFNFTEDKIFDATAIVREAFLPDDQCFVLYNLFTAEECQQLIHQGESYGFISLADTYTSSYRNNERIINYNLQVRVREGESGSVVVADFVMKGTQVFLPYGTGPDGSIYEAGCAPDSLSLKWEKMNKPRDFGMEGTIYMVLDQMNRITRVQLKIDVYRIEEISTPF
jgi:hypothetical protein